MPSLVLFKVNMLPKAIESGCFGENVELIGLAQNSAEGRDQFASTVLFVDIELKVDGVVRIVPLVCKFQRDSAELRDLMRTDLQFYNEVVCYKQIIPMLHPTVVDLLPRFYFGQASLNKSPEDDVVIVENLMPLGYRLTDEKVFLDFQHCCLAFRKLGEFHGGSIRVKAARPLRFTKSVNKLKETRWLDTRGSREEANYFYGENAKRGVIPLVKVGEHLDVLIGFLERLEDVHGIVEAILAVNDESLLCHGDFCRNNMIFKYEQETPVDVKFFDLATARYASPVIDISFFLFLNTRSELRRRHFREDFLRVYLEGVRSVAGPGALSMGRLWKEFQEKALYGYFLAAFFLPIMLNDLPDTSGDRMKMTVEEKVKKNLTRGGLTVTEMLTDAVRDLVSWGCV